MDKKENPKGAEALERESAAEEEAAAAEETTAAENSAAEETDGKDPAPAIEEEQSEKSEYELLLEKHRALEDQNLRLMAEYDNYRKRTAREKDEAYGNATAAALERFLTIADNFDRAMGYDKTGEEFAKGFEMIAQSFSELLTSFGVEPIGEVGEPFDPNRHNAVMHIEDENLGENVVSQVLQKGYRMGDRVLRYAMVQTAN